MNVQTGEITMSPEEEKKREEYFKQQEALQSETLLDAANVSLDSNTSVVSQETLQEPKHEPVLRDKENLFKDILGPGYAARLAKVFTDGIVDRFMDMSIAVSYADQDEEINDDQRKLIHDLEDAFIDANCIEGPSKRLMDLIDNKKPNLRKMIKPVRMERVYSTLMLAPKRLKFITTPKGEFYPVFFTTMAATYKWNKLPYDIAYTKTTEERHTTGKLLSALIARYANSLAPDDYVNMWFVVMFLKNLSVCSMPQEGLLDTNPEIGDYIQNLFKLVDHMLEVCVPDLFNGIDPRIIKPNEVIKI